MRPGSPSCNSVSATNFSLTFETDDRPARVHIPLSTEATYLLRRSVKVNVLLDSSSLVNSESSSSRHQVPKNYVLLQSYEHVTLAGQSSFGQDLRGLLE